MTEQQILQKAIKKAFPHGATGRIGALIMSLYEFKQDKFQIYALERTIIFSKEFAKAFYGEEMAHIRNGVLYVPKSAASDYSRTFDSKFPIWQYHLQQQVLSENPIRYLEPFLEGVEK